MMGLSGYLKRSMSMRKVVTVVKVEMKHSTDQSPTQKLVKARSSAEKYGWWQGWAQLGMGPVWTWL